MLEPGDHENSAMNALTEGDTARALAYAVLALAASVDRLAGAQADRP